MTILLMSINREIFPEKTSNSCILYKAVVVILVLVVAPLLYFQGLLLSLWALFLCF